MPALSKFYGISVKMFFKQSEHNPPHIHALYGEYIGEIDLNTVEMIKGDLPAKALALVKEWVKIHQDELLNIWNTQTFSALPPLE